MLTLTTVVIFLGVLWALAFFSASRLVTTCTVAIMLGIYSYYHVWSWWILTPLWLIFLAAAVFFNTPVLRRRYFSAPMLHYFRRVQPAMSETEQIALEAGDVYWEGELFRGAPDWNKLSALPKPELTVEEESFLNHETEKLCALLDDWKIIQEDCDLSPAAWNYIKEQGFFGLVIAKEYGGKGFSAAAHSAIVTKIATRSMSAAVTVMVPNSLGPGELITHYGTAEQKKHFLPRLAKGLEIPCFGLTSLLAGSDANAMKDHGIVCRGEFSGKEMIGIRLTFDKRYITLAPVATLLGIAFKLYDPDQLLGDQKDIGITLCLVPRDHPGIKIGQRHLPMHLAFMNGSMQGKDIFIPLDWIIGGPALRGQGWRMLMECLGIGRGISLPALSAGGGKLCYRTTGAYALLRQQFKMSIGKLEGVQEALARIAGFTYICEATRIFTANAVDQKLKPALASAITKYHLTELSRKIVLDSLDIHAGKAVQLGPKNYIGLAYDALPTSITVEGANILTRNLIIFGQGALRCHPYIRNEIMAAQDSDEEQSLKKFDRLFSAHLGYGIRNFARNLAYSLTGGRFIQAPDSPLAAYYRQFTRMSTALALTSDITMAVLGGQLKRKERLSARLGDVLSYLYLATAVFHYFESHDRSPEDMPLAKWSLEWCLANIQIAFDDFFANFPQSVLAKFLHRLIFPWGRAYKMPADTLGQTNAEAMLKITDLRERLTYGCYLGNGNDGVSTLEKAFKAVIQTEPLKKKLREAVQAGRLPKHTSDSEQWAAAEKAGILSTEEIQLLDRAQSLYLEAIAVDEFEFQDLGNKSNDSHKNDLHKTMIS